MPKNNTVYSLFSLLMCSFFALGCGDGSPGDLGVTDSDGVTGDDSDVGDPGAATAEIPDDILSEPGVAEAIVAAENAGLSFGLHRTSFPPEIAGTYTSTGDQILPEIEALSIGSVSWANQTSDNRITLVTDESDGTVLESGSIRMNDVFLITNVDTPDICGFTTEEALESVIADRLILIPETDSQ